VLPFVMFMSKREFPKILEFIDEEGDYFLDEITVEPPYRFLLGFCYEGLILIFPQGSLEKVETIFHEFLHWINYKFLSDKEWIDNLIDLEFRMEG